MNTYAEKRRVTIIAAGMNLGLAIGKVVFGFVGQSQALIADGIHSFSDLATDVMVLVAAKYGSESPDFEHPYGHAKFETVVTIGLGLLLLGVALGITIDAGKRIMEPVSLWVPGPVALAVTMISIIANEWFYRYTVCVAARVRSGMIRANAWHHRTDAISSAVVLIGILGTMAGIRNLDAVAAVGVSLIIGKVGWDLGWGGIRELVDTGLSKEALAQVKETIESTDGVQAFHKLRTRKMGEDALVDVHIMVKPELTVSEGHMIADNVRARLKRRHKDINDILVHVDPEDDAQDRVTSGLPSRESLLRELDECWQSLPAARQIERINLHYLEGRITAEVVLPMGVAKDLSDARSIAKNLSEVAENCTDVDKVLVYYH